MQSPTARQRMWRRLRPYWVWFAMPFLALMLLLVALLLFTESSIVAPFVYLLF